MEFLLHIKTNPICTSSCSPKSAWISDKRKDFCLACAIMENKFYLKTEEAHKALDCKLSKKPEYEAAITNAKEYMGWGPNKSFEVQQWILKFHRKDPRKLFFQVFKFSADAKKCMSIATCELL
jgi:hypothetical protein